MENHFLSRRRALLLVGIVSIKHNGYAIGFQIAVMGNRPTHYTHYRPFLQPSIQSYFEYSYKHIRLRNSTPENHEEDKNDDLSSSSAFYPDSDCLDLCDTGEFQDQDLDTMKTRRESDESSYSPESLTRSTKMRENSHTFTEDEKTINMSPKQMMKNIELRWSIEESNHDCDVENLSSCSEPCSTCRGVGTAECTFCSGSGYIDVGEQEIGTMGDILIRQNGGRTGIECPVCNENGDQVCSKCMGSGWIAKWRMNLNDLSSHP